MAWGLSETGFNRPNQAELQEEVNRYFRESFGDDVNLSSKSPDGILAGLISWLAAKQYELAEDVYHSGHPSEAEGVQLDYLTVSFKTSRNPEQYAEDIVEIEGTPNFTIDSGTRYETETGVEFATKTDVTLNAEGKGTVEVVALTAGITGNVDPGTITVQSEPSADVLSITNINGATGGRDKETDEELRARLTDSSASSGSGTVSAILASVLNVKNVRSANIIVNNSAATVNGQPPHSNQVFALGGNGQEIADTLMNHFTGIQFYGTQTYTVRDIGGSPHTIGYTPATAVNIYTDITVTTDNTFENSGINQIKDAVVKVIGGTATDGTIYAGLSMGDDVIYSRILSTVMSITGVTDATVKIGKAEASKGTSNITISPSEVAQVSANIIAVTATA